MKYKLTPVVARTPRPADRIARGYIADDLHARLLAADARFHFSVQLRTDEDRMPLNRATVRWDEALSPPRSLATLTRPHQDIRAPGQLEYGEGLSYTAWHSLPGHAPVGSLQEARRFVYQASADLRRRANGTPAGEPRAARSIEE